MEQPLFVTEPNRPSTHVTSGPFQILEHLNLIMPIDDASGERIPYSPFLGVVRVSEAAESDRLQDLFMDYFFSEFFRFNRARRFSGDILSFYGKGDADLPRKRYFAVCGPKETDDGLLRNEMDAYLKKDNPGEVLLVDQRHEHEARFFGLCQQNDGLLCVLSDEAVSRFSEFVSQADAPDSEKWNVLSRLQKTDEAVTVVLRTKTHQLSIPKCIDLRLPDTRQWFFDRYRKGVEGWPGYGADAADVKGEPLKAGHKLVSGFHQMLSALLDQTVGGVMASQVIGCDLRRCGADALIYPSARCDAFVIIENGEMTDWYGWNLVDYRGANQPVDPHDAGVLIYSEGEVGAASKLRQAAEQMKDSAYRPKGSYQSWNDFRAEFEQVKQNAAQNPDDGPKIIVYYADNFWWPPQSPVMTLKHPSTGPHAGSLLIEGIETTFRDKVIAFSQYRK